jgi:hypothetical protein
VYGTAILHLLLIDENRNPMMHAGAIARTGAEITHFRFTCVVLPSML